MSVVGKLDPKVLNVTKEGITPDELMDTYKTWAGSYDHDNFVRLKSVGPDNLAKEVVNCLGDNKNAKIIDLACGTGIMASKLKEYGFTNMDGLDPSPEMLDVARSLNIYDRLLKEFLVATPTAGIEDNQYDFAIVSGGFAIGHLKADCIEEILRMIKPGCYFLSHSNKRYYESNFLSDLWDTIDKLCQDKKCELIKKEKIEWFTGERFDTMFVLKKL